MNIHEHQAKQILKKYGAAVPNGVFGFSVDEVVEKAKKLNTQKYVLKAQIHAGGRGKAGGVKILSDIDQLTEASKEMLGKTLVTHQTGPNGKEVKSIMEVSAFINSSSSNTIDIGILRNDRELIFSVQPKVIKSEDALGNKTNKKRYR